MNKLIIPLALYLLAASPKAKADEFVLPIPLNENTIETICGMSVKGNNYNSYSFSFYSASKRSDNKLIVIWGFNAKAKSNIENYVEIFRNLENDYKTAIESYETIKTNTNAFVQNMDNLEAKINDPSFTEKAENVKNFVTNWNSQLPLDLDYSYDKNDVEQFAKFVNTASDINKTYSTFKEMSEFITETKNNASDNETRDLAYAADASRENIRNSLDSMSSSTARIYNVVTDKNLELPYANTDFSFFFSIMFPFYGEWLMK